MTEQTLMSRMRSWFKRTSPEDADHVHEGQLMRRENEPRNSLFHPFAKRDAALQSLQSGFVTLTDLMVGIREGLERQSTRSDELLSHLAKLPQVLEQLPESSRVHSETLKALHEELSSQHASQQRLTEILDHVSKSSVSQKETLEGVQDRIDRMRQTDEQIADNLTAVGTTMQELGRNTSAGAHILENMRDNITARDTELQNVLARQGTRFTVMLSIAIFLSIAALVAVAVIGYLLLMKRPA
ncbi:MAG TPA: hypothetical protein VF624_01225 [Tepidisphaeraceae bacterium]|jgi:chromosome segregation ATPase